VSAIALRRFGWAHPEFGAMICAGAAWLVFIALAAGGGTLQAAHEAVHRSQPLLAAMAGWLAMCLAMMVPAAAIHARSLAMGALWERRQRTLALFYGGYLGSWLLVGLGLFVPLTALRGATEFDSAGLLGLTLLVAAAWACLPWMWRALRRCRLADAIPPRGARADRACLFEGLRYGGLCLIVDGPAMLVMVVAGHEALGLMAALATTMSAVKILRQPAVFRWPLVAGLLYLAAITIALS
jgi:hypothetical protein